MLFAFRERKTMGQYYVPVLTDENGNSFKLESHAFGNGLKLMEHSWIGNNFVNAAYCMIYNKPMQVAWIGDYSMDGYIQGDEPYMSVLSENDFATVYSAAWDSEKSSAQELQPDVFNQTRLENLVTMDTTGLFLSNYTLQAFLDLGKYIRMNRTLDGWCVNPLPLLTACGNGRGGGDYCDTCIGYADVGIWAFHWLLLSRTAPDGFHEKIFRFKENN